MTKLEKVGKLAFYSFLGYCAIQYYKKAAPLKIDYHHEKLKHIIKLNPSLSQKVYYPSFFFPSGHVQTILLLFMNRIEKTFKIFSGNNYSKTRKVIKARDGEYIYVDFFEKSVNLDEHMNHFDNFKFLKKFDNSNVVVIIPGACGRTGEFYITDVMERLIAENFKCIAINHRGILKYPLQRNRLYHSGYTDDLKDVFEYLNQNIKGANFFLLGFSMGGNIVTKFVGEIGDEVNKYHIKGGSSICGPLDLKLFSELTEKNSQVKLYSRFFCKNLKSVFHRNADFLLKNMHIDEKTKLLKSINTSILASEFYINYILSSFGYKSEEEYQRLASGSTYVKNIKVPFLCIFAEDDPLIPHDCLDNAGYEKNENFILAKTKSGGHVGFFKGFYFERWIYEPIVEFIRDTMRI